MLFDARLRWKRQSRLRRIATNLRLAETYNNRFDSLDLGRYYRALDRVKFGLRYAWTQPVNHRLLALGEPTKWPRRLLRDGHFVGMI